MITGKGVHTVNYFMSKINDNEKNRKKYIRKTRVSFKVGQNEYQKRNTHARTRTHTDVHNNEFNV